MQYETALFGDPLYFSSPSVFHENLLDHSEKSQHVTSLECILTSKIDKEMAKYIINGAYQNNKQKNLKVYFAIADHTRNRPQAKENYNILLPFENLSISMIGQKMLTFNTTQSQQQFQQNLFVYQPLQHVSKFYISAGLGLKALSFPFTMRTSDFLRNCPLATGA